jgi:hypothetical protein
VHDHVWLSSFLFLIAKVVYACCKNHRRNSMKSRPLHLPQPYPFLTPYCLHFGKKTTTTKIFFLVLGFELRTSFLPGRHSLLLGTHSTTWTCLQFFFVLVIFQVESRFFPGASWDYNPLLESEVWATMSSQQNLWRPKEKGNE